MSKYSTSTVLVLVVAVIAGGLGWLEHSVRAAAQPAGAGRSREAIMHDMQAVGEQIGTLLGSEDAMFDPARRAQIAPRVVPLLHRMIALCDEQAALDPQLPPTAEAQIRILSLASLMGDEKADQMLVALSRSADTAQAGLAQASRLLVTWWKSPDDADRQSRAVDDLEKLARASPAYDQFQSIFQAMAEKGAANEQLRQRVRMLAMPRLKQLEGKPLTLNGLTVEGRPFSTEQWKGRVILVDFWATWSPPCMHEMPRLKKAYKDFNAKGLEILGISCDKRAQDIATFRANHPDAPWPQLFDKTTPGSHPLVAEYGVQGIPTLILIDRKGIVRTVDARQNFEAIIPQLLGE
jgi:thiol-disulfide isomerase/thioredoxin